MASTGQMIEPFENHADALEYAERNGLNLVWEGTAAFAKREATLPSGAFQVCTYRSRKGLKRCGLFSKHFTHIEFLEREGLATVDRSDPDHLVVTMHDECTSGRGGGWEGKGNCG